MLYRTFLDLIWLDYMPEFCRHVRNVFRSHFGVFQIEVNGGIQTVSNSALKIVALQMKSLVQNRSVAPYFFKAP